MMRSSSPVASLTGSEVLSGPIRPHHPSYERLILKLFRQTGKGRPKQPLHLTSIRAQFVKLYQNRYWFPPSWPRHLYQRLREMERKEVVESSGPGNLYFRLTSDAYQGLKTKRTRRTMRKRKAERSARGEEPAYVLTSEASELLASTELTEMISLEQSLRDFQPMEDILRIEGRLGTQLSIVDRLLRLLASDDASDLQGIQRQLDNLVLGRDVMKDISIEDHISRFQATLEQFEEHRGDFMVSEELAYAVEGLQEVIQIANSLERVHVGEALLTLSTLVAGLLQTVKSLRKTVDAQSEQGLRGTIDVLQKDLEETRAILASKEQAEKLADEELELVLESEEVILGATREATEKMVSLSDRLESDLKEQRELKIHEASHYESMIEAIKSENEMMMKTKEDELTSLQSELASVNDKYNLAASHISELDLDISIKQHQINDQLKNIDDLSEKLAEQVKLTESLEEKIQGVVKIGEEVGGGWSEMDRRMSGLLTELASFAHVR